MKYALKKILLATPGFQVLCRFLTRRHVRVLMYHRFSDDASTQERFVTAKSLKSHLRYIKQHHPIWSPDEQLTALQKKKPWEPSPVVVTVDDGYRDFYEVAYPVFKDFEIKPVLFVTTGFVEHRSLLWWDKLRVIFEKTSLEKLHFSLSGKRIELQIKSDGERNRAWNYVADLCRFIKHEQKENLLRQIAENLAVSPENICDESCQACTWEQIVEMAENGVVIGAHTENHPILSRLDPDRTRNEIVGCKIKLEEKLRTSVDWFCYPQGGPADFTVKTMNIVRQAGFKGSYIAYQALQYDLFTLPRYCVTENKTDFSWCLCGAEFLVLKMRRLIGRPTSVGEQYWRGYRQEEVA
ncbi:polysaccharide deacetylase family protein [Desulfofustis glycolicus]|uniref:Polysaccharide deacetylase n=1 Tax=Desulfofustis glycolicus DSM 9705 TaxID=1121409 RepID=A0A1M5YSA2_9BACT|nr:polysaccharide deacetylase family protein [Desulfofustis glycolicus]SHI14744.1 Polysaccharide deacetylase [Desulfofustis glycolicus DSM 9705]